MAASPVTFDHRKPRATARRRAAAKPREGHFLKTSGVAWLHEAAISAVLEA